MMLGRKAPRSLCTRLGVAVFGGAVFGASVLGAAVFCATVLATLLFAPSPARANNADELKGLREKIRTLKQDLEKTEGNRAEAADALRDSESAISEANRALKDLGEEQQGVQTRLQGLGTQSKTTRSTADAQAKKLASLIREEYQVQDRGALQLLFSGLHPATAARELHYASYVSRAQVKLIEGLRGNLKTLDKLAQEARERAVELAEIETKQKRERSELARESETRRKVLRELASQIRSQRREVSTLERNESRLTQLIERLAKLARAEPPKRAERGARSEPRVRGNPSGPTTRIESVAESGFVGIFSSLRGKLKLPSRGELAHRFGSPREDGGVSWKGVFIRTGAGEEVRAVAPGRVVFADWMRGFGNLLIVDHGNEYLSIYGNNETLLKQAGENVDSGVAVARAGNSGGNPETGLYFELRHQGKPFDPMAWVRK